MNLAGLAIKNYQFTVVMVLLLSLVGLVSYFTMPRSEDPTISAPGTRIIVIYPGASPADIESLIIDPIEDEVNALDDIKDIESSALDGLADISVEMIFGRDPDDAYDEVTEAVNRIRANLPAGVLDVQTFKFSTADVMIYQVALSSSEASYTLLKREAEKLEDRFEQLPGVMQADVWAYPEPEVRVSLDLEKMGEVGISLDQIIQSVQASSQNIPGGSVDAGERRFNIRTSGDYESLEDIRRTIVSSSGTRLVYLDDVSDVEMDYEDDTHIGRFNGERSVFVTVAQREQANIYSVMEGIYEVSDSFAERLPDGVELNVAFDQSISVRERVNSFFGNLLQGILLVGIVIFLALGLRASSIVVIAIPISLLIAFGWVDFSGYGIQQMSIVGLVVALGLLVDNAIVVTENVARFKAKGMSGAEAAIEGTREVGWPVIAATVTTILSFLPIVLIQNDTGDYIRSMPVTVIFSLIASLLISLTLTPLMASWFLGRKKKEANSKGATFSSGILQGVFKTLVDRYYRRTLKWSLGRPAVVLVLAFATFIGSLLLFPLVGVSLFPKAEKPLFYINVEAQEGATLDRTDRAIQDIESVLADKEEVVSYIANVGRDNPRFYYNVIGRRETSNIGQVVVATETKEQVPLLVAELKQELGNVPGVDIDVLELENGPPIEAPIAIKVSGPELERLKDVARDVERIIASTEGTENINNPLGTPKTDLHVRINRDKAGLLGVPLIEIDRTVRASVAGLAIADYRDSQGETYDIVARLPVVERPTVSDFDRISVSSFTGSQIPLRQVADIEFDAVPTQIDHYNLARTATVTAYVEGGYSDFEVTAEIIEQLDNYDWPPEYQYYVAGVQEAQQESFGGLASALVAALLGILGVLVLQFRSFYQPLIIIVAVPLAVIGSIPALLITGFTFSFSAFIGLTSLVGIVVNNSIILVDYANQLIKSGKSVLEAVIEASETRFSPILLTTLTTIGGLLPLTLTNSTMWSPMGWVIIGGLIASTALTLIVVPVLYKLFTG
ncbi:MAG: efflux RND transporter permease subunit [Rhodothermaceae bacterium]|nr:efflux RND transporter permease subunit [Rhodothermaceae bacterium]